MINIYGPANSLGYGIHSQNMTKALAKIDKVSYTLIGPPSPDPYYVEDIQDGAANLSTFSRKNPSLFIYHDHSSHTACGKPLMVFSVFETTQPSADSINMLKNGPADMILTTTLEHKDILDSLNLGKPVQVVHEGIDPVLYNTNDSKKFFNTKKFTFLLAGKREKRKNTDMTFKVLLEECMYKESTIICHTFNPFLAGKVEKPIYQWIGVDPVVYGFEYKGYHKNYHQFSNGVCDIILTTPEFKVQEMQFLYKSANVGICCSSGEGWGLPVIEMMGCGIPVITTNCMGHKEFLPTIKGMQSDLTIGCSTKEVAKDNMWFNGKQGEWSIVSEDSIRDKVKYCLDNTFMFNKQNLELANYIKTNYSWTQAAARVKFIIDEYTN
jgi:glycosyltransferase involved in cell wall biosynthesis